MDADDSDNIKLVDHNESSQSERTVFVMPPEPIGLPVNAKYSYNGIVELRDGLFGAAKPKPDALNRILKDNDQSAPGSPIARRTKQEIKCAQKNAKKYSENPHLWAKYLLSTCYRCVFYKFLIIKKIAKIWGSDGLYPIYILQFMVYPLTKLR